MDRMKIELLNPSVTNFNFGNKICACFNLDVSSVLEFLNIGIGLSTISSNNIYRSGLFQYVIPKWFSKDFIGTYTGSEVHHILNEHKCTEAEGFWLFSIISTSQYFINVSSLLAQNEARSFLCESQAKELLVKANRTEWEVIFSRMKQRISENPEVTNLHIFDLLKKLQRQITI